MELNKEEISGKVKEAIEQLRPFLHADGGDMELVEITDDAVARVRLFRCLSRLLYECNDVKGRFGRGCQNNGSRNCFN